LQGFVLALLEMEGWPEELWSLNGMNVCTEEESDEADSSLGISADQSGI